MALVNVINMVVLDNPTNFCNPFQFEITFECLQELQDDLEWKVLYVSSAEDASRDQILEEILVGPIPVGVNKFVLQADAPDPATLEEILEVTVILVTCSYREKEFLRVGYYVNNEYHDPEAVALHHKKQEESSLLSRQQQEQNQNKTNNGEPATTKEQEEKLPEMTPFCPTKPLDMTKVVRQILADKPRVTRFPIPWGSNTQEEEEEGMAATAAAAVDENENDISMVQDDDNDDDMQEEDEEEAAADNSNTNTTNMVQDMILAE